ncbi:RQC trigger complex helicase Slh1p [Trichomonascus vanleenenianus]|uniref:RNA helicase n=1 Tax=Trichomonascus vanleenenianus TaxID=2268995 RepID=UPI003EC9D46B
MNQQLEKLGKPASTNWSFTDFDNDPIALEDERDEKAPVQPGQQGSWLAKACADYVSHSSTSMSAEDLKESLLQALKSPSSDDELQATLADMLGYDHLDFLSELIQRRRQIINEESAKSTESSNMSHLMTLEEIEQQRLNNQAAAIEKASKLQFGVTDPKYPHVYRQSETGSTLSAFGSKYTLPVGTERFHYETYEEVTIPYPKKKPTQNYIDKLIEIKDLDPLCRSTFHKYKTLNKMQSLVYPVGYKTNENLLVCAPTGAGKTDVALLTMLCTISQHSEYDAESGTYNVNYDDFKIVYVAPLKALAAEIVEKMGKRLAWLGIRVRELTGDMQLTRAEISETQVIVTTPEKWDVVTRKSTGDNELVQKVKLLIIDEVHLLHEERGAVIESLVARTLRQVESSQSLIRIVGLSATLPNFMDVAEFLRVNLRQGMFYFDSSFRPVPLKQMFIGAKGKAGSKEGMKNVEISAYEKLVSQLAEGHQVMVFVHSRKDTIRTARSFISRAQDLGDTSLFDCSENEKYDYYKREMSKFKNKDMRELFQFGFGVHHAGMLRSERNQSEQMFLNGAIKVLCCTATLAWGVNLPAAVVIIKGTQVYDPKRGGFVDLDISDVIQIFGRAGRPQFEKFGTGILCTTSDKLSHYLAAITQQHPIESKLQPKLADNLNAEISLGTVTNIDEGVQWLGYTYLYVRMRKNPLAYGLIWSDVQDDPLLGNRRRTLVIDAARRLHSVQMIVFDERTGAFIAKDTGRVASDFYLLNNSVEIFNAMMKPNATEADILAMLSMSGEFDSIKSREEEAKELTKLRDYDAPCQVAGTLDTTQGKTNVLLQAYISRAKIEESSLVSDAAYVGQNAIRISRALFLIAMNRRWGRLARMLLSLCKSVEKRLWSYEHPLAQFSDLPVHVLKNLEEHAPAIDDMKNMDASELGDLAHNHRLAETLARYVDRFPLLHIDAEIAPVTGSVLRVHVELTADFVWDARHHGKAQFFWVWVEDSETFQLYHVEKFILSRAKVSDTHVLDFTIPLADPAPPQVVVRAISDTWAGAETTLAVSFQHLVRPDTEPIQTKLLRLRPLPVTALHDPVLEGIYEPKFQFFNPMQTMIFNTLYHQDTNVLLGSPTGSGKTVAAELAMWWAFKKYPKSKVVYIAPMKALVRERVDDWRKRLVGATKRQLVELTGDSSPDAETIRRADIIITTPEKFDGISRSWQTRKFVQQVSLIIMDEIHLLASDRGPILEMIVSRMNYVSEKTAQPVRLLGMSTAVANAADMASWLQVKPEGLFNFPQSVRPVPLQMYIDGFPDNVGFCPLMKTMNKPAFLAIKSHSPTKPVLIFVASRRQTRVTAQDLIQLCGMEENPRRFLAMEDWELEQTLAKVKDETLKLSLQFGIVLHHAGLVDSDRRISHELFATNKAQILIATSTLAWGVNLPAHLVIIKGTQFFDAKIDNYRDMDLTDVLQMMGRAGRPAFDTSGVAMVYTKESTKAFYKYFLNTGFPVESSLHKVLEDHLGAEISSGAIRSKQDALDFLTWTFLFRRIHKNPTYYGIEDTSDAGVNQWAIDAVEKTMGNLVQSGCLQVFSDGSVQPTPFLGIASYYYMSHKTVRLFLEKGKRRAKIEDVLVWLCSSTEYDELAIRHNEDVLNAEMSAHSRYPVELMPFRIIDPHSKAFLLLQAHMARQELPIADYVQDTISVLDQSLRILQAMADAMAEVGFLSTVLQVIKVMQCIKQACWDDVDPVSVLPGLKPRPRQDDREDRITLQVLGEAVAKNDNLKTVDSLGKKLGSRRLNDFKRVVQQQIPVCRFKAEQDKGGSKVKVELSHVEHSRIKSERLYTKFHKPQKESWFVIIGDEETDRIYRLRRVSPYANRPKMTVEFNDLATIIATAKKPKVYCINDAMDLRYEMPLVYV